MDIIKKYWWCFLLALVFVPICLNFILLIPAFTPVVGDNANWLSFLGTLIGALASFAMIFFTAKTLEQNREQLNELKRQWDEEHTPSLSCQLIPYSDHFMLQVLNTSNVTAHDVSIKLSTTIQRDIYLFDKLCNFLNKQTFTLPPRESIYFDIMISLYKDIEQLPDGYIDVTLSLKLNEVGTFKVYPKHYAFCTAKIGNPSLHKAVEKIADKIGNSKYLVKL